MPLLPAFPALAAFILLSAGSVLAAPWLNEIYFHPPQAGGLLEPTGPEDTSQEWLEIHNPDPAPLNLTGWRLANGIDFTFPAGTTIPAGGYLVVSASPAAFAASHQGLTATGPWTGDLSNIDDTIELIDPAGLTTDSVHYETEGNWAKHRHLTILDPNGYPYGWTWLSDADGGGKSLELANPALSHTTGQNWPPSLPRRRHPRSS